MNEQENEQDEQWLNALAGRPHPEADGSRNRQAAALRRALEARRKSLEAEVPAADQAQLEQIMFRLRREGLLDRNSAYMPNRWRQWAAKVGFDGLVAADAFWRRPAVWGVVASLLLVVGVVVQMQLAAVHDRELEIYRGSNATVLLVEQPEVRLREILVGLRTAGEDGVVKRLDDGRLGLKVKATQEVLDYLGTQRIEPLPKDGWVYITIARAAKSAGEQ